VATTCIEARRWKTRKVSLVEGDLDWAFRKLASTDQGKKIRVYNINMCNRRLNLHIKPNTTIKYGFGGLTTRAQGNANTRLMIDGVKLKRKTLTSCNLATAEVLS
jgi:hypothetical protein